MFESIDAWSEAAERFLIDLAEWADNQGKYNIAIEASDLVDSRPQATTAGAEHSD